MQAGSLNFLEPSGPVHACNGIALPLPLPLPLLLEYNGVDWIHLVQDTET